MFFFHKVLGFTRSHLGPLNDIEGIIQLIPGSYKSEIPKNIIGVDKILSKCDCINGSIVNGIREPILYSFALRSPAGQKIFNEPKIKIFIKINKSVLSPFIFYSGDDDHKPVDFNGETISFTCQLIKI